MLFNSIDFAIFFPVVFVLYWGISKNLKARNLFIIAASYLFYGWWDWRFLFLIIISSIVDYYVGLRLNRTKNPKSRRGLLFVSLLVNLGFLVYFKYANFFIETFVDAFSLFGREIESSTLNVILPVGISFYTFQTLSYTIDIYRKQLEPTKDALSFFAFVAFFPQLVAGPIERAAHLLPQFYKAYNFDYKLIRSGLLLMAFGLFKKMVIADRVAILVNQVYNNPSDYYGAEVVIATIFFAFQIYCDFSGYSDIAIGAARTLGFDLMKNFDSPYFSKSITEFWRRWHISLSTWFRDYVYIPLGGSRKGKNRTYVNLFIVFIVSGLWHGAAMTFVIWGAIHGIFIVVEKAFTKQRLKFIEFFKSDRLGLSRLVVIPFIFAIVCFAWIFFRANSLKDALLLVRHSWIKPFDFSNVFNLGLVEHDFIFAILAIIALMVFERMNKRTSMQLILQKQAMPVRWSFYVVVILTITIFGIYGENQISEFIYFQF